MARIEDYGLIGDCETAALVGRDGSIDWLCWPRFDSDACFAALLGGADNGRWRIHPRGAVKTRTRAYRGATLVLETSCETRTGRVTLVDFMPPRGACADIVRIVRGDRGHVPMAMDLVARFGYGAQVPWVVRLDDGAVRAIAGPDSMTLRTPVGVRGDGERLTAAFTVEAGDAVPFVLTYARSHEPPPRPIDPHVALEQTEAFWTRWIARFEGKGPWGKDIRRSLITLKALTYAPTGGIVAAATTSLPEQLGGTRNWDYRYCWVRDATLSLLAMMNAGFFEEAAAWRDWLLRAVAGNPRQMQIMYGIAGERRLTEWSVPWLAGYEGASPVRIGNAAHAQLQLDVYGELMDTLHHARRGSLTGDASSWELQRALLAHLETIWREPDAGIWEGRGDPAAFTYSRVMAWVAFDRAVKSVERLGLEGPVSRWRRLRARIHREVCSKGYDRRRGTFVRAYGSRDLDASLLLMPQLGFLPPDDPRIAGTVAAIERDLVRRGFVLRYDSAAADDGLPVGEGAFLACSFWLADAYTMLGRHRDAKRLFERLLAIRNDLGLLSEEYDVDAGRLVGNFPQAFSHIALVNTALNLRRIAPPAEQRADRSGERVDDGARRSSPAH
ncbi:glycoside hydrolase family 15 protein [Dokdonella sp.]|uniref:glycoside hydrolase family 15 protein n=1 Tax=Dokdonella sp. TaxID=2291710 RepID=UPI002F3F7CEA